MRFKVKVSETPVNLLLQESVFWPLFTERGRSPPGSLTMKCFHFSYGSKRPIQSSSKFPSSLSCDASIAAAATTNSSSSSGGGGTTDQKRTASRAGFGPRSVSLGADPARGSGLESFSEKSNNLKVFTYAELKNATRNFNRSLIIGEGSFGCVYKGIISSPDDPRRKREIAVKQLDPTGLQVGFVGLDYDRLLF